MAAYVVRNPKRSAEQSAAAYALLDFMLGGWYGAKITLLRGYLTNPQAGPYAKANQKDFSGKEAEEVAVIEDNVKKKFRAVGGLLLVPLGLMFVWSFGERAGFWIRPALSVASYAEFFSGARLSVLVRSLNVAAAVTALGPTLAHP